MSLQPSNVCCYAIRLKPGQDLVKELISFVSTPKCSSAFILTCVGSLKKATLRMADFNKHNTAKVDRETEIVSLVGTLSKCGKVHLHISLSDSDGNLVGGHLSSKGAAVIHTTAEIVLGTSNSLTFTREFDDETGFDELVIT